MSFPFFPTVITDALTDLSPQYLKERGIRLLMMDFDNTIVPYTTNIPTEKMAAWLAEMSRSHIQLCVVSNSRSGRVQVFCEKYGIPVITRAKKPGTRGIEECLSKFGIDRRNAAIVGDQIFTDTLGGNRAGVTTILVRAIDNHNIWLKLRHVAELPFILAAYKRSV